jgi:hypothetical protein
MAWNSSPPRARTAFDSVPPRRPAEQSFRREAVCRAESHAVSNFNGTTSERALAAVQAFLTGSPLPCRSIYNT